MQTTPESTTTMQFSIGQKLRQAREARSMPQEDAAKQLFLTKQTIMAIEEDNYTCFVALVYVRGYIASYAKLLQLDQKQIIAEFDALNQPQNYQPQPLTTPSYDTNATKHQANSDTQKHWLRYTGVIIITAALVSWGFSRYEQNKTAKTLATSTAATATQALTQDAGATEMQPAPTIVIPNATKVNKKNPATAQDEKAATKPADKNNDDDTDSADAAATNTQAAQAPLPMTETEIPAQDTTQQN